MQGPLPILPFREKILETLQRGRLVLTAPTGSGKSTQLPRFILEERDRFPGKTLVLEPRRLAARSLAHRVAHETRTRLGEEVGYHVRFDSRCGRKTRVLFETYGVFVQHLLSDPSLPGVGTVLLDEFHERTLEADFAIACLARRKGIRVAVLSATLESPALCAYLEAEHVHAPSKLFPVEIRRLVPARRDAWPDAALEALKALFREKADGSALVFMPGMREIRWTLERLGPFCREQGLLLGQLHGSMELSEQQKALDPGPRRVIVSTNVAETSLTLPDVTMVVDSGMHRIAAYDPGRDINSLTLSRVSLSNARQRAGRAGRTAPGRCVRLWSEQDEASMQQSVPPEVRRLELSRLRLMAASMPSPPRWLTEPDPGAWSAAGRTLAGLGALGPDGRITAKGRALLAYPAPPRLASVLEEARRLGPREFDRACAMVAALESDSRRKGPADLSEESADLDPEARRVFEQLRRCADPAAEPGGGDLAGVWLKAYADRLGARQGEGPGYAFPDGRKALLPQGPPLILALDVRQTLGGGQARHSNISAYLPCSAEAVQRVFPEECVWEDASGLDEARRRAVREQRLVFRGLTLAARHTRPDRSSGGLWAEKLGSGELKLARDDVLDQLVARIRVARGLYPDCGFPAMDADDWRLVYEELCEGKRSWSEIEKASLKSHVCRYIGDGLAEFLDKALPTRLKLKSGRYGRLSYAEGRPAELSARIGDLIGMKPRLALCEGRLPVLFDILAPNHRTVQKTEDLGAFWKGSYLQIKRELQRKYPKHPWP